MVVTSVRVGAAGSGPHATVGRVVSTKVSVAMPTACTRCVAVAWVAVAVVVVAVDPPEQPAATVPATSIATSWGHRLMTEASGGSSVASPPRSAVFNRQHPGQPLQRHLVALSLDRPPWLPGFSRCSWGIPASIR